VVDRPQSVTRALVNMVGAAIAFSILNVAVKSLRGEIPTIQLVWVRTLGHLLFVIAAFAPRHGLKLFETQHPVFQLIRSVLLLASTLFYFTAIGFVALATAAAISFMTPCLIAVLAGPLLSERVGLRRWVAVAVGFLGVLVVARPGADTANLASLLVLGSAAASALYDLLTRRVVGADPPETTVGYAAVVGTVVLGLVVPFAWTPPRSWGSLLIMLSLGLWGGLGHYLTARAYQCAPASAVAPFTYLQLVGAAIAGYLAFGELPGAGVWVGAALIVASGLFLVYAEGRARRA
jgi:drug/metabolite transporter (DMT)-like permease